MARVRKAPATLDSILFATPEQKILRLLLAEPTTSLTPRMILSKLKGVRGLGGAEGILGILTRLKEISLVDFVDNHRAVRLQDDNTSVRLLKVFCAVCDLENLRTLLEPISSRGVLFGSRSTGRARTESDYDLFIVSETPEEIRKAASRHPMAKQVELLVWTPEQYERIAQEDPGLDRKLAGGIILWGAEW
jgi:hypothetical protein